MSKSTSSNSSSKKKKPSGKAKSDSEVQAYWNANAPVAALSSSVRNKGGKVWTYPAVTLDPEYDADIPSVDASEQEWGDKGWHVKVEEGSVNALWLPLWSSRITSKVKEELPEGEQDRCIPCSDKDPTHYWYPERTHVDRVNISSPGKMASTDEYFYIANVVRPALSTEKANCRIVLDWDRGTNYPVDGPHNLILVSTCKMQAGMDWRYDVDYVRRVQQEAVRVEVMDDSEEEALPVSGRAKLAAVLAAEVPVKMTRTEADDEYNNRMISAMESCGMSLSTLVGGMATLVGGTEGEVGMFPMLFRKIDDLDRNVRILSSRVFSIDTRVKARETRVSMEAPAKLVAEVPVEPTVEVRASIPRERSPEPTDVGPAAKKVKLDNDPQVLVYEEEEVDYEAGSDGSYSPSH